MPKDCSSNWHTLKCQNRLSGLLRCTAYHSNKFSRPSRCPTSRFWNLGEVYASWGVYHYNPTIWNQKAIIHASADRLLVFRKKSSLHFHDWLWYYTRFWKGTLLPIIILDFCKQNLLAVLWRQKAVPMSISDGNLTNCTCGYILDLAFKPVNSQMSQRIFWN